LGLIAHVRQARPLEDFQVGQIVRCCVLEVDTHKEKAQEIVL
jgi:ribosomal protein S1